MVNFYKAGLATCRVFLTYIFIIITIIILVVILLSI